VQQSNQNGETSATQRENAKKLVTAFANEVVGFEGRKQKIEWCDEGSQINV